MKQSNWPFEREGAKYDNSTSATTLMLLAINLRSLEAKRIFWVGVCAGGGGAVHHLWGVVVRLQVPQPLTGGWRVLL